MSTRKFIRDDKSELDFMWAATAPESRLMCQEAAASGKEVYIIFVCTGMRKGERRMGKGKEKRKDSVKERE